MRRWRELTLVAVGLLGCGGSVDGTPRPADGSGDTGGAESPPAPHPPGPPEPGPRGTCTVREVTAKPACASTPCPIVVSATLDCATGSQVRVAPGAGDRGFLAVPIDLAIPKSSTLVATIDPTGVSGVEEPVAGLEEGFVVTTAAGDPSVLGYTDADGALYLARSPMAWTKEVAQVSGVTDAAFGPDGTLHLLANGLAGRVLASRTPAGVWSSTALPGTRTGFGAFAIDEAGHTFAVYEPSAPNGAALVYRGETGPEVTMVATSETGMAVTTATARAGSPVALLDEDDGVHSIALVDGVYTSRVIAETDSARPSGCPDPEPRPTCEDVTCHETAANTPLGQRAIARTDDGAIFIAWTRSRIDRDVHVQTSCARDIVADRTTTELVLGRLAQNALYTTVRFRMPIDNNVVLDALAARGSRVYLALEAPGSTYARRVVRYLVVDTSLL